jgi:hypothetical protein
VTQRFYANLVNLLDMEADETAERGAEDVVRNDAGNDDRSATNSHESEFSDSDAEDAINRRKRCRRPLLSVPIGASALSGYAQKAMAKFITEVDGLNRRLPKKGPYRASAYCCVVYDAVEKQGGNRLLRQGRVLTASSRHIDEAFSDQVTDPDNQLHKLFQNRLVFHHMAGERNVLEKLHADFDAATVHADDEHAQHAAHDELEEPQRVEKPTRWEDRARTCQEMMLSLYNMEHGTSFGKS